MRHLFCGKGNYSYFRFYYAACTKFAEVELWLHLFNITLQNLQQLKWVEFLKHLDGRISINSDSNTNKAVRHQKTTYIY